MYNIQHRIYDFSRNKLSACIMHFHDQDTHIQVKYFTFIHQTASFSNNNVVNGIADVLDDE